jgi:CHAT domain-containing protein
MCALATAPLLIAEDPPAVPDNSLPASSRQALLDRRRDLLNAANQHEERQDHGETLRLLSQTLDVCRQIDSTYTDAENVGVLFETYRRMIDVVKNKGDYAELVRIGRAALDAHCSAQKTGTSDRFDAAVIMVELAIGLAETGANDEARGTLLAAREKLRGIEATKRSQGIELLDARICMRLANDEFRQGHLRAADQHFADAVELARTACDKFKTNECRRQLAAGLYHRARILRLGGRIRQAAPFVAEAYELCCINYFLSRLDADAVSALQAQVLLGAVTFDHGANLEAKAILESAVAKSEGSLSRMPTSQSWRENALLMLLAIAIERKDYEEQSHLRDKVSKALIYRKGDVMSVAGRFVVEANRYLGRSFQMTGDIRSAERHYLASLELLENMSSVDFESELSLLLAENELIAFYSNVGRLEDACRCTEDLLNRAKNLFSEQEFPNGHAVFATICLNSAAIFKMMGEADRAAALFEYAVNSLNAIRQQGLQVIDPTLFVSACVEWSKSLISQGRFLEADTQLQVASSVVTELHQDGSYGSDACYEILAELGRLKRALGGYVEARDLFRQALEIATEKEPSNHIGEWSGVTLLAAELGRTYAAERDYPQAIEYHRQSLVVRQALFPRSKFPNGHPSVANALRDLGTVYLDSGDPDQAFALLKESVAIEHALGEAFAGGTSEAQLLNLAAKKFQSLGPLLESWAQLNRPAEDVYSHVWLRHGFVARVTTDRQCELRDLARNSTSELYEQYLAARQDLARALLVSLTDDSELNQDRRELLQQLNTTKENLEQRLTREFESVQDENTALADIQKLQQVLPQGAVFVDFVACRRRPYDATVPERANPQGNRRLFAFVVDKTQPVQCVDLGDANRIDNLVKAWNTSLTPEDGHALRSSVWDPISVHFPPDTDTVYIAPDEELTSIAWAALPYGTDGRLLLDDFSIALVPYGKFLLEQLLKRSSGRGDLTPLLVVADIDYGGATLALADNRGGINDLLWAPLPETRTEANAIQSYMPSGCTRLLTGAHATLPRVLEALPHVRSLHFATHGFYLDDVLTSKLELAAAQSPPSSLAVNQSRYSVLARNPFLRSGLVLAGANQQVCLDAHGLPYLGDSVLSGEAVMALNAENVELVVLSACDSGKGDAISGEGSWGILGAFHAAGTRNVVGGLWRVSDQATAKLMTEFYRHLGQDGMTPLEALRAAQLTMARQSSLPSSDRGVDFGKTLPVSGESNGARAAAAAVRDWAGFVLSGPGF